MADEPRQGAHSSRLTPLVRTSARLAEHARTRKQFRRLVKDKLFPAWRVRDVAEWYWVKVASETGEPVWPLTAQHRRCYEGSLAPLYCMNQREPLKLTAATLSRTADRSLRTGGARRRVTSETDNSTSQGLSLDSDRALAQAFHPRCVDAASTRAFVAFS